MFFLMTRLQVRHLGGFSRTMAETTWSHARVKPFVVRSELFNAHKSA